MSPLGDLVDCWGMPVPRWLDRIWLVLIALAFVFCAIVVVPAFITVWAGRVGWTAVILFISSLFLVAFFRGLTGRHRDL